MSKSNLYPRIFCHIACCFIGVFNLLFVVFLRTANSASLTQLMFDLHLSPAMTGVAPAFQAADKSLQHYYKFVLNSSFLLIGISLYLLWTNMATDFKSREKNRVSD
jgi:hypothetical protein